MILDGSYVGVIMRVTEYTVDCAVALGAPLGFGRATNPMYSIYTLRQNFCNPGLLLSLLY